MTGKKTRGFALVEIILGIGVLAIVGLIIVQMFIAAANTQNRARDLDSAVILAQSAAETFRATGDYASAEFFDKNWEPCGNEQNDGYTMYCDVIFYESTALLISVRKNSPYPGQDGAPPVIFELEAVSEVRR